MNNDENRYAEMKLEDVMTELEEVLSALEDGKLPLEDAFELYHQGMIMMKACTDKIDTVEKKMTVLETQND